MDSQLAVARSFIEAVQAKDDDAAAELCSDEIEVLLPGAGAPLTGKDGVRQMINLAPKLEQSARGEELRDDEVRISTLTRAPGVFANYTTWIFVFERNKDQTALIRVAGRELMLEISWRSSHVH